MGEEKRIVLPWRTCIYGALRTKIGKSLADKLRGDLELIEGVYPEFDSESYLAGDCAPVFFDGRT